MGDRLTFSMFKLDGIERQRARIGRVTADVPEMSRTIGDRLQRSSSSSEDVVLCWLFDELLRRDRVVVIGVEGFLEHWA